MTETQGQAPVLVRVYVGREQRDAASAYGMEAQQLGSLGYRPVTATWAEGQWTGPQVIIALFLTIFVIGIFLVGYMIVTRPDGTLTVTYVLPDHGRNA